MAGVVGVVEALGPRAVDKPQHGDRERSFEGRGAPEGREFTRPPVERVVSCGRDGGVKEMWKPGGAVGTRCQFTETGLCDLSSGVSVYIEEVVEADTDVVSVADRVAIGVVWIVEWADVDVVADAI